MFDASVPSRERGEPSAIKIDIVSDVVCPWCYIGKRNIEAALRERPDIAATIHWRPYQLDPTIPLGGYERQAYLARKFGGRAQEVYARVATAAKGSGLELAFDKIGRSPNTLDAHRLIRWAWSAGAQDAIVEELFRAFFIEGQDIGDRAVLVERAQAAGMDGTVVRQLLDANADVDAVEAEIAQARELGVTGVPFFILDGSVGIPVAQPPDVLVRSIEKVLERRTAETAPAV